MELIQKDYIKDYQIQNMYELLINCNSKFKNNTNKGVSTTIYKYVQNHDCYIEMIKEFLNKLSKE